LGVGSLVAAAIAAAAAVLDGVMATAVAVMDEVRAAVDAAIFVGPTPFAEPGVLALLIDAIPLPAAGPRGAARITRGPGGHPTFARGPTAQRASRASASRVPAEGAARPYASTPERQEIVLAGLASTERVATQPAPHARSDAAPGMAGAPPVPADSLWAQTAVFSLLGLLLMGAATQLKSRRRRMRDRAGYYRA
jgi:hypothetical protein